MTISVIVHTGTLALSNGAIGPITKYFALAGLLPTGPRPGQYYGDDRLLVPESDWSTVEALLAEEKLPYKVEGQHTDWQNLVTEEAQHRVRYLYPH